MIIAAVSDTHIPARAKTLPDLLVARLKEADLILHSGDFTSLAAYELLAGLGRLEAVRGNVDDPALQHILPATRVVEANGVRFGLVHGDGGGGSTLGRAMAAFDQVDCIVFGHSHMPYLKKHGEVLMINPGSPTDRRSSPRPSFALITVSAGISAEFVYI